MGDVVDGRVNWTMLRALNGNPEAHWIMGRMRRGKCSHEHDAMQEVPEWAYAPLPGECPECGELACLFVEGTTTRVVP